MEWTCAPLRHDGGRGIRGREGDVEEGECGREASHSRQRRRTYMHLDGKGDQLTATKSSTQKRGSTDSTSIVAMRCEVRVGIKNGKQ